MAHKMQFGVFSVGDLTIDPTSGTVPTESERINAMTKIAVHAEEAGLDVFAQGEHHNPPFVPSSPTTMLGYIAAKTKKILLSTSTTPHHHERSGKTCGRLRHAAAPSGWQS